MGVAGGHGWWAWLAYQGREDGGVVQPGGQLQSQLAQEDEVHGNSKLLEGQTAIAILVRELPTGTRREGGREERGHREGGRRAGGREGRGGRGREGGRREEGEGRSEGRRGDGEGGGGGEGEIKSYERGKEFRLWRLWQKAPYHIW